MALLASCLDSLMSEEDNVSFSDETAEATTDFIDNLNGEQFEKVMNFVQEIPKLQHEVKFLCESCNHDNKITLEGMNDFF